jgi:serine/threonine protein kinase
MATAAAISTWRSIRQRKFLKEDGSPRSDIFSLGVITYQILTGQLPYGTQVPKATDRAAQRRLAYRHARVYGRTIPAWVDDAIQKAVHPNPAQRYADVLEFVFDLQQPNKASQRKSRPPLIERDPLVFWKGVSFLLACALLLIGLGYGLG